MIGIILCSCILQFSFAQQSLLKGKILNDFTNEPFPFASVYWLKAKYGVTSDSAGNFNLNKSRFLNDTLVISYVGYNDFFRAYSTTKDTAETIIYMPSPKINTGATVKSKFNKGLRWWKNIVTNKEKNDPYRYDNYAYELYNKLELDINNINKNSFDKIKLLQPFGFLLNNIDSVTESKPFLPVFLTESISDYYSSINPNKTREEIKAVQTNGIKNETILQLLGGINGKINIYENYYTIFSKEFISPLSNDGDKYYNYKGADTQTIAGDKFFHLYFSPKQQGVNTFSGDCWIHSTTWAIERITLNTSPTADINFVNKLSIIQEFQLNEDKKWLFAKDKIIADLSPLKKSKTSFIGRKTTTYRNIQINQISTVNTLSKSSKKDEIIVDKNALSQSNEFWKDNRHEHFNSNEAKVYQMIDTLKQMPLFKKYTNTLALITDGHKKLGMIEIGPWYKWLSGNQMEKIRTRFDLGTTEKFSKQLKLHSYLAYGFGDEKFKGKFDVNYRFKKETGIRIWASYTNDLDNGKAKQADEDATIDNMFSQIIRRPNIKQKFIGINEIKFGVTKDLKNDISAQFTVSNTNFDTYQPLPTKKIFSYSEDDIINTEFGFKVRYAPGEKKIISHRKTRKLRSKLPVLELNYAIAVPNIFKSEYQYHKLNASISQTLRVPGWGQMNYMAYGGKTFGEKIPFMMLEVHPGNEIYYYNKNSFNLMNRFEYVSDQYYGLNFEHNIEKKIINYIPLLRKTKIRQFYNLKSVYGNLTDENRKFNRTEYGGYHLRSLKGNYYTEIGTGLENIFNVFRIDAVWRFAPTITTSNGVVINTTKQKFGLFGSFRFQF